MNTEDRNNQTRPQSITGGRTRRRFALRPLVIALAGASLLSLPGVALSPARAQAVLPSGLSVAHGQAQVVVNGQQMTVTNSANSILNWQSFSIGNGNGVHFAQPDSASQVLNRVVGNDPSAILGSLSSNGRVWLLNPNGVLFGQNARVDVGGLVTSTLRLNDIDWLNGRFNFAAAHGDASTDIVNRGELRSSLGGRIALLGGSVRNEGLIDAPDGQVLLAAGRSIDLVDTGSPNLRLRVTAPAGEAMNLGTLAAAGGRIDVHAAVVNQNGIVRADGLTVNAAGQIEIRASRELNLAAGSITSASGASGGDVLLDAGEAGTLMLRGDVRTTGSAGSGGQSQLLGRRVGLVDSAKVDASGTSGGGQVLVGGGLQGKDPAVRNAEAVYVGKDATIDVDAKQAGSGGRIILWGDVATRAYGSFSARGGSGGGDGGFIETSGGWIDIRPARLDASASAGLAGTWLLDPFDIDIVNDGSTTSVSISPPDPVTFTATDNGATIDSSDIAFALNNGNSVVVSTGTAGTENGDITFRGATINVVPNRAVSFTLNAARHIVFNPGSRISSTGQGLSVNLNAAGRGSGVVFVNSSTILTNGGNLTARGTGFNSENAFVNYGITISSSNVQTGAGNVDLIGDTQSTGTGGTPIGIWLTNSTLTGRDLLLRGGANFGSGIPAWGVNINNAVVAATHSLDIRGDSSGIGVGASQSTLHVAPTVFDSSASLAITGRSASTTHGIDIAGGAYGGSLTASNGASMTLFASHGGGTSASLNLSQGLVVGDATGGAVTMTANSPAVIDATIHVGGPYTLFADDVTISLGASIRSDATGDAIIIAGKTGPNTTRFFNNNAGCCALSAPNGRWLVFGQNTGSVIQGGLAYDFKQYNARFGTPNPFTPATGNGLMYFEAPVVTITGDNLQKTYDGSRTIALTGGLAFTGQRDLDTPTVAAGAIGDFDTKDVGTNKPIAIGPGAVSFRDVTGKPVLGYGLDSRVVGDIFRKTVSMVGVTAQNKVYDGNTTATVMIGGLNGLIAGETLNTTATGNFDTKDVGNGKIVSVVASIGNGGGGGLAGNYRLDPNTATTTADITRRTVTAGGLSAANKVYDGNRNATVTIGPLSGLVAGETLGVTASGLFDTKDAGTGKTVTVDATLTNGTGGGLAGNYQLAPVGTTTADINRRTVTLAGVAAQNKVYDGNTLATISVAGLNGLVGSETLTTTASGNFDTKDVGNGKIVSVVASIGDGGGGGLAGNYRLDPNTATTTADITRRTVTAGGLSAANKIYDGNRDATVTVGPLSGLVAGETLGVTASGLFDTKDVGNGKTVTVSAALANGAGGGLAGNYQLTPVGTTTADITRRQLSGTVTAANKVYDANTTAAVTLSGLGNLVGSETLLTTASGNFDTKDVGTGKPVTVLITLADGSGGGLASNYLAPPTGTPRADITPASLTITANNASKTFGTTLVFNGTEFTTSPLQGGETVGRIDLASAGAISTASVAGGPYAIVASNARDGSFDTRNYAIRYVDGSLVVNPADIRAVLANVVGNPTKTYDGNDIATLAPGNYLLNGFVGGDNATIVQTNGRYDSPNAGNRTITVSLTGGSFVPVGTTDLNNYLLPTLASGSGAIVPRPLTLVGLSANNKVYDGNVIATLANSGSLAGLVGAQTLVLSNGGARFDTKDAGTGKTVTVDGLTLSNGSGLASNYLLAPTATTTADITRRQLGGSFSAANKVYDGNTSAVVTLIGLSNLVGNETLNTTVSGQFDNRNVGNGKPVAILLQLANGANGGLVSNYLAPPGTATASITPATLTYVANPAEKIVDAPLPPLSGSVSGFVSGENLGNATTGNLVFTTAATPTSPFGRYAINGGGLAAQNYNFVQAASNATALSVTGLSRQQVDERSSQDALNRSLAAVALPPVFSSPAEGRVFDVIQTLRGEYLGQGALFRAIPVEQMSQESLTSLLAARDQYKKTLFAGAIRALERDPTLADAPACRTIQEVDNGSCLITEDLKRQLRGERDALQVAGARPSAPSAPAAPAAPAAPVTTPPTAPLGAPVDVPAAAPRQAVGLAPEAPRSLFSRRVRTAALPQIQRKIAVVIGVNRYADRRMPQLENAVGDARAVGQLLDNKLGYETIVLENSTKQEVIRTLNRLAVELNPTDSVVVYYAGHGELVKSTGIGYWQLSDSNPTRPETWLSNDDISRLIGRISADQVALISDSCYSGSLVDERIRGRAGAVDPQQLLAKKTVVVMSSGGNEPVFDEGKNGHSPFAFSLMRNLEQVANWQPGGNVFERVRFAVARELPQRPLYGSAAAAGHQPGGDYLFEQRQLDSPQ